MWQTAGGQLGQCAADCGDKNLEELMCFALLKSPSEFLQHVNVYWQWVSGSTLPSLTSTDKSVCATPALVLIAILPSPRRRPQILLLVERTSTLCIRRSPEQIS